MNGTRLHALDEDDPAGTPTALTYEVLAMQVAPDAAASEIHANCSACAAAGKLCARDATCDDDGPGVAWPFDLDASSGAFTVARDGALDHERLRHGILLRVRVLDNTPAQYGAADALQSDWLKAIEQRRLSRTKWYRSAYQSVLPQYLPGHETLVERELSQGIIMCPPAE